MNALEKGPNTKRTGAHLWRSPDPLPGSIRYLRDTRRRPSLPYTLPSKVTALAEFNPIARLTDIGRLPGQRATGSPAGRDSDLTTASTPPPAQTAGGEGVPPGRTESTQEGINRWSQRILALVDEACLRNGFTKYGERDPNVNNIYGSKDGSYIVTFYAGLPYQLIAPDGLHGATAKFANRLGITTDPTNTLIELLEPEFNIEIVPRKTLNELREFGLSENMIQLASIGTDGPYWKLTPRAEDLDHGDFFLGEDPEIQRISLAASNAMNVNPSVENVFSLMDKTRKQLLEGPLSHMNQVSAKELAASTVRGSIARVVAHRMAMNLASIAVPILKGNDSLVRDVLQDPDLPKLQNEVSTNFGRSLYGDEARLYSIIGLMTKNAAAKTIDELPSGIRAGMLRAGILLTHASEALSNQRGVTPEDLGKVVRISDNQGLVFLKPEGTLRRGDWLKMLTASKASGSVIMDAKSFLDGNIRAASEHILSYLTDVLHGFIPYRDKATSRDILQSVIANLHLPSVLAFMANMSNIQAEYENRYVWQDSEGEGSRVSKREPLVHLIPRGSHYDIVRNQKSEFANASRKKRNRCSGPDAVDPIGQEVTQSYGFRKILTEILKNYDPKTISLLDRNYSEIDIFTSLIAGVACVLIDIGDVTFDQENVSRHLRASQPSTGAWTNQN